MDRDDDLGGGSFFVEGGANGGGQNGRPNWNVNARYENNWDEDADALGGWGNNFNSRPWGDAGNWRL